MQRELTYVGIDVSKEMLDVALRPADERWSSWSRGCRRWAG